MLATEVVGNSFAAGAGGGGDDLLDDRVVAVGGLGGEHLLTGVGEDRVVAPHGEQLVLAGRDGLGVQAFDPAHDGVRPDPGP